jgi:hypothetical protein
MFVAIVADVDLVVCCVVLVVALVVAESVQDEEGRLVYGGGRDQGYQCRSGLLQLRLLCAKLVVIQKRPFMFFSVSPLFERRVLSKVDFTKRSNERVGKSSDR